jgi:pantetheine-phosphate adenylyltransferase
MANVAFFPGSFDPVTLGHVDLILRGSKIFDRVVVGLGSNTSKQALFSAEQRLHMLMEVFQQHEHIEVVSYEGLTIDYCMQHDIRFILRGVRNSVDLDYERSIAESNKTLHPEIETVFLISRPAYAHIQSTIVRELIRNKSNVSQFLPHGIQLPH